MKEVTVEELKDKYWDFVEVFPLMKDLFDTGSKVYLLPDISGTSCFFIDTRLDSKYLLKEFRARVPEHLVDAEIGGACPTPLSMLDNLKDLVVDATQATWEVFG